MCLQEASAPQQANQKNMVNMRSKLHGRDKMLEKKDVVHGIWRLIHDLNYTDKCG